MRLIKSHGLGNDYLVLTTGEPLDPATVRWLCDRHRGVGADGVLEPVPARGADHGLRIWGPRIWGLRIWNPDGSQAEKSGNGLRIFARWLVDHRGAPAAFWVEVPGGRVRCEVDDDGVTVQMGRASFLPADVPVIRPLRDSPVDVLGDLLRLTAVGLGNPHCVVFVDEAPDTLPWRSWGRALETSQLFPNRTNVQVARVTGRDRVEARIWERGAGETLASGSSACAVAASAVALGRCDSHVQVVMPGGTLSVEVADDFSLTLRGPVEEVAEVVVGRGLPGPARA